jgi:shikimate kinase
MDELILKKSGRRSVGEIFEKDGEITFRELEIAVAKDTGRRMDKAIVSTGGGVVVNRINLDYLKTKGKVFYLKTSFRVIKSRLKGDCIRPLFKNKSMAKKLFEMRQSLYKAYADFSINTDDKNIDMIVNNLLKKYENLGEK